MEERDPNEYFIIPNPIYDVVFKYLMEDLESAKIFLSTLLNEKIIRLAFEPISHAQKITDESTHQEIRLFHLDFTATIELADGTEELMMIELQKANMAGDIFRFKRYISANFQRKQAQEVINPRTQAVETIEQPIRLIPIFILNFRIENEIDDLIIKTNRTKRGLFKDKQLKQHNEFIDNLSYDMWVIQLPNLDKIDPSDYEDDEYKSNLYALLKLFDQKAQSPQNRHRLLLIRKLFPIFLKRLIARLKAADAEQPDLEEQMHAEDEYLAELRKRDNTISFFKEQLESTTQELESTTQELESTTQELESTTQELESTTQELESTTQELESTAQELESTSQELESTTQELESTAQELEKEKQLKQQKEEELAAKEQALKTQQELIYDLAKVLKASGIPLETIEEKTKLSPEEIERL